MLSQGAQRVGAKFGRQEGRAWNDFHPLICHMLDVAAVAEQIWDNVLPPVTRGRVANAFGAADDTAARSWVAFLAGLHDLGKSCPLWQQKFDRQHWKERLAEFLPCREVRQRDPGHGAVTARVVESLLTTRFGVSEWMAWSLAEVLGGHHGYFPESFEDACGWTIGEAARDEREAWDDVRTELFDALAQLTGVGGSELAAQKLGNADAMLLAGLVCVADWIGSADGFFAYDPSGASDLQVYQAKARTNARGALERLGWLNEPRVPELPSFRDLFEFEPRPLQKVVEEEVAPSTPRLVVVEAPMGEGKTEAALLLASRWAARGFRGGYVALPTQATANQIHQRTRQFLEKLFPGQPVNLQLVHGGLLFDDHGIDPAAVAGNDDPGSGDVEAAEWFLPRKRSLLGFWGVGTVDQALLAVLQVKHVFVRLFGLAGKPVIIDEVHAYDTYMTGLLERLLEWLAALGSPVVLLSATLPSGRRRQLFAAYERGQGHDASSDVSNASYPSLTWLDDAGVHARSFESKPVELGIDWLDDDLDAIGDFLERQLAAGGCAAVICNTVGRAQETYRALEGRFAGRIDLFHSRFRAKERHEIEERCRELFGPPGPGTRRPESYVLVATQVIEQSLDLDFDLMVTDFAPADLLLQRSGRLWRHKRSRPPGLSRTLYIRRPGLNEPGIPTFDAGTKAVYDEHILLRTWWALHERSSIAIPGDVQELIDFVYSEAGLPAEAGEALRAAWDETQRSLVEKQEAEREEARSRRLPFPLDYKALSQVLAFPVEEDQPDLHPRLQALTRLARPEIPVVALSADSSLLPLGTSKLDRELQRRLLEHSVSVGRADAVARLRQLEVPAVFAATPALRRHRVVVLDEDGRCDLGGGLVLAYDAELGLRILGPEAS